MIKHIQLPPDVSLLPGGFKVGGWWHTTNGRVICDLCPRKCSLKDGDRGFCFVRENSGGRIVSNTYGRSTGFCVDPVEKKPLNHFYPGTSALSFGTAGCNLGCKFCQNWTMTKSREVEILSQHATPDMIANAAERLNCKSVAFTYNDPVVWAEYAIDTAHRCHERGIKTVAVTSGYICPEARAPFFEAMDAANVDLKGFSEQFYQRLTLSHLQPVLDTLRWIKYESSVWLEITNLIIPAENDSTAEIRRMCQWILENLGDDVPVHFTAFQPHFRLRNRPPTPPETLTTAYGIGKELGLQYVYTGNVTDTTHQSTYCPNCDKLLIERNWYALGEYHLKDNRCGFCGFEIAGFFDSEAGDWGGDRMSVDPSTMATRGKE